MPSRGPSPRWCRRSCAGWDARTRRCCSARAPTGRSGSGACASCSNACPGRFERHSRTLAGLAGLQPRMPARACARQLGIRYDHSRTRHPAIRHQRARLRGARAPRRSDARARHRAREVKSAGRVPRARAGAAATRAIAVLGGVYNPHDESGDAHRFTAELARLARSARGQLSLRRRSIERIEATGEQVAAVRLHNGEHP